MDNTHNERINIIRLILMYVLYIFVFFLWDFKTWIYRTQWYRGTLHQQPYSTLGSIPNSSGRLGDNTQAQEEIFNPETYIRDKDNASENSSRTVQRTYVYYIIESLYTTTYKLREAKKVICRTRILVWYCIYIVDAILAIRTWCTYLEQSVYARHYYFYTKIVLTSQIY